MAEQVGVQTLRAERADTPVSRTLPFSLSEDLYDKPTQEGFFLPHFIDGKTEAKKGQFM